MTKRFLILIMPIFLVLALTGCDQLLLGFSILHPVNGTSDQSNEIGSMTEIPSHDLNSTDELVERLRATGAEVTVGEPLSQPFFEVIGQIIHVNDEDIQVFEFADETAAENAASQISPDGSSTGTTMITWVAPPHFYRAGKLIVLYVGENEDVINLLVSTLGTQFAGQ